MKKKIIIAIAVILIIIIIAILIANQIQETKSEYEIARNRDI